MKASSILTIGEVGGDYNHQEISNDVTLEIEAPKVKATGFGWFTGVCGRVLLNIFGVMLFLRSGWVVGSVGTIGACLIVLACVSVTILTALSLSAIATNGSVKGGGLYFLVSRNLGAEYGGTIGIVFFVATSISVAMYVVGFGEALIGITDGAVVTSSEDSEIKLFAAILLVFLLIMVLIGVGWVVKMDMFLLAILMIAIVSVFVGAFTNSTEDAPGFSMDRLNDSWGFRMNDTGEGFFSTLAVFFPAVTGVMAGANISGELRDPSKSIPKGTLLAVVFSSFVYLCLMVVMGGTVEMDVLYERSRIMEDISVWSPLFFAGVISATVSSALASLVGAPRVLQAVSDDGLFPWLRLLVPSSKGEDDEGQDVEVKEPIKAYFVTFVIAMVAVLVADLNTISPLITNFFLISYALVNYACFQATRSKAPGWRPSFKYYSTFTSLLGAILCVVFMFLVNAITAGITLLVCIILYLNLRLKDLNVSYGDFGHAHRYTNTLKSILDMEARSTKGDTKNYRPAFLTIKPDMSVLHLLLQLKPSGGLVFMGDVGVDPTADVPSRIKHTANAYTALKEYQRTIVKRTRDSLIGNSSHASRVSSYLDDWFLESTIAPSFSSGVRHLFSLAGIGTVLRPNALMIPFPDRDAKQEEFRALLDVIRQSFYLSKAVVVPRNFPSAPCRHRGRIDVYWLVDDGGLSLLLPVLLMRHSDWSDCNLRVITTTYSSLEEEELRMTELLRGFRIKSDLCVLPSTWITDGIPEVEGDESNDTLSMAVNQIVSQNTISLDPSKEKDLRLKIADLLHFSTASQLADQVAHQKRQDQLQDLYDRNDEKKSRLRANTVTVFDIWAPHRHSIDDERTSMDEDNEGIVIELTNDDDEAVSEISEAEEDDSPNNENDSTVDDTEKLISSSPKPVTSGISTETTPLTSSTTRSERFRVATLENEEKTKRFQNLHKLIREFSSDASMVMVSLPVPHSRISDDLYLKWLNLLSDFNVPVMLIRGNGENVMSFEA